MPKLIGDRTTLAVMLALRAAGFVVLLPFGENARYDLVIDNGEQLSRVQCKTGRLREGAVRFKACSTYAHHARCVTASRDYHGEVDYFAIHCPQTAGVYLVPITDLSVRVQANLRVRPARNGQNKRIRLAETYKIGSVRVRTADSVGPAQPVSR
ncbi:MAG: group I intron-associated PD-(D/E)XK endonuclease [Gaiellaceae bacterium]